LRQEFKQPHHLPTSSQGNVQLLPNGNWFIGWGATPWFSEFAPDGTVIFDASFPASGQSYRSYRLPWVSHPTELPALSSEVSGTNLTVYASWNGATEVATWDVLAGPQADTLDLVGSAPRTGFETSITVASNGQLVAVRARDKNGASLATSAALPIGS
ncbi:MAG TPA: hypothetical protein VNF73_13060, partial [Candidatus Saccharimonadales bacterium]|nr:hypothetical protein [Candidatus Saccharimonadales bacterium]